MFKDHYFFVCTVYFQFPYTVFVEYRKPCQVKVCIRLHSAHVYQQQATSLLPPSHHTSHLPNSPLPSHLPPTCRQVKRNDGPSLSTFFFCGKNPPLRRPQSALNRKCVFILMKNRRELTALKRVVFTQTLKRDDHK